MQFQLEKIKSIRNAQRKRQKEVAEILEIDQGQYSRKERGEVRFDIIELELMAGFFEVDMAEFFNFSGGEKREGSGMSEWERKYLKLEGRYEHLLEQYNELKKEVKSLPLSERAHREA